MKRILVFILLSGILLTGMTDALNADNLPFTGRWELVIRKSSQIDLFKTLELKIDQIDPQIRIIRFWGNGDRSFIDTLVIPIRRKQSKIQVNSRVFPTNPFMGVKVSNRDRRIVKGSYDGQQYLLRYDEKYKALVSQGSYTFISHNELRYDAAWDILEMTIRRESRGEDQPVIYRFKRKGSKYAWYHRMTNGWTINRGLPEQACWISLEGLVNNTSPQLYLIYPSDWDFRFTPDLFQYFQDELYYTFRELKSLRKAIDLFRADIKGYVLWNNQSRTSLVVAYTIAGLENALVIDESLKPMMDQMGIPCVKDLRDAFYGKTDAEIYLWAYQTYGERCSKDYIVWLGGESGEVMKPGVADWGMKQHAFFTDLSTNPGNREEYRLADHILQNMNPMGMVFGWHSYAKDKERDHVTLCSSHGLRVEGLHTLPNMSFSSLVKATPYFKFENHHNLKKNSKVKPGKKVYIACVQTDCLGLGAWNQPGRGNIPYAWEVTMNWVWLAPALMEYFYRQATPNDYFIGALGGPGYMYPKAVPPAQLPQLIQEACRLMNILDLNIFEIMDYSEGSTLKGNTELPENIVKAYFKDMPGILGLINGYSPSYTFGKANGKPVLSYDYYLSPDRPEEDAVADLQELARINSDRPYFLLMHVRQWSNITRVQSILNRLGPDFEIVPLDLFFEMARQKQTYTDRFLEK